jgi:hypothetical protein
MALVTKVQKLKDIKQYNTHSDSLDDALVHLSDCLIPLVKHRISTNKNGLSLSSLLSEQLINPVINRDLVINSKYIDVPHYFISQKGIEYIKRYESLQLLLV